MHARALRRLLCGIVAISAVFTLASCGKEEQPVQTEEVTSAVSSQMSVEFTEPRKPDIKLGTSYYDNLNAFLSGQKFDGLVSMTTDSYASLDEKTRRYPVSYFFANLAQQNALTSSGRQIIFCYVKDGIWHVHAFYADGFNNLSAPVGEEGMAGKMDVLTKEDSLEKQLAIMLMHYYPDLSNTALGFMVSGSEVCGDVCYGSKILEII